MTRAPDPERLIRAYLDEGLNELPDRVYEVVRSDSDRTRQRVVIGPWRTPDMNSFAKLAMAAAAVVVVAIVGYNLLPSSGGVGVATVPPSTAVSASPSTSPSPSIVALPSDAIPAGALRPGTYTIYAVNGTATNVRFTVPAGWKWEDGKVLMPFARYVPRGGEITFWTGDIQVYAHPCQWQGTEPEPPTGPTARDLIDALAAQPLRNASTPVERNAAGPGSADLLVSPGWSIDLEVPDDADFSKCDKAEFRSWGPESSVRYHQGPGQRDTVWAIDGLAGERVVVDVSSFPLTKPTTMTEAEAILGSMEFSSGS